MINPSAGAHPYPAQPQDCTSSNPAGSNGFGCALLARSEFTKAKSGAGGGSLLSQRRLGSDHMAEWSPPGVQAWRPPGRGEEMLCRGRAGDARAIAARVPGAAKSRASFVFQEVGNVPGTGTNTGPGAGRGSPLGWHSAETQSREASSATPAPPLCMSPPPLRALRGEGLGHARVGGSPRLCTLSRPSRWLGHTPVTSRGPTPPRPPPRLDHSPGEAPDPAHWAPAWPWWRSPVPPAPSLAGIQQIVAIYWRRG